MQSILHEIEKIRSGKPADIDFTIHNRYILSTKEADSSKTAYCFSVPVYNTATNNMVELIYRHHKTHTSFSGSSAAITIKEDIGFQNRYGCCRLSMPGEVIKKTESELVLKGPEGNAQMVPTLNGLLFKVPCSLNCPSVFSLTVDGSEAVRYNDKYFAVMRDKWIPLITVSCIGAWNQNGSVIAPCEIRVQKTSNCTYELRFHIQSKTGRFAVFEINMHENKLFQDTTVESRHPKVNNAFGGIAFLGATDAYGEQWLYSRLEFSNLPQLHSRRVRKAVLHIPDWNRSKSGLTANRISERFCSFGSNWSNKISVTEHLAGASTKNGYHHLDLTSWMANLKSKTYNFVIRANGTGNQAAVISTGDCYARPQIMEINFY